MKLAQHKQTTRAAFTLIELLVVIAIIAILVGLTAAAVFRAFVKGTEVTARHEITQLSTALGSFKQKFGVYPPSRLRLGTSPAVYPTGTPYDAQLSADSIQFIRHCFPRFYDTWVTGAPANYWSWPVPGTGYVDLEGDQVLVFCLGGLQVNNGGAGPNGIQGFSTDPTNPMSAGGDRIGPFFEFKSAQLVAGSNGFFAYNDPWKTPYAYFSSGKRRNGYNAYYNAAGPAAAQVSDCASLNVWPYFDPNNLALNPETFQIISAGSDQVFGQGSNPAVPGSAWTSKTGQTSAARLQMVPPATNPAPATGLDDISNFHGKLLGVSGD